MTVPEEIKYLYSIRSVRETNSPTDKLIQENGLQFFDVDLEKMGNVVSFVIETIKQGYPTKESLSDIPIHGRFQHFNKGDKERLPRLIDEWRSNPGIDELEVCKRLIDLFVVSVLLDAGAGNVWKFEEPGSGQIIGRSEGIAIASLYMFKDGVFGNESCQVNGEKLVKLTDKELMQGLQIDFKENPINGFEGRLKLLKKLGETLISDEGSKYFGNGRPGDLIDYLMIKNPDKEIDIEELWEVLIEGLLPIWPREGRMKYKDYFIGDAWILRGKIVTFHKLTQWLCYSLMKPLFDFGFTIKNSNLMTGLPEYRNGGLFIDLEVLKIKPEFNKCGNGKTTPVFKPDNELIIEWRSCTICLLDRLLPLVNESMNSGLTLPQLIEAGTWQSGRRIAFIKRGTTGPPPIELDADGTVF